MRIRLLADDLTGAMDSARPPGAAHRADPGGVARRHPPRRSRGAWPSTLPPGNWTRPRARQRASAAAALLAGADIAYLKCDSLLRGWAAEEIAGCLAAGAFDHCVIAPAFPAQRRVTRQGRQWAGAVDGNRMARRRTGLGGSTAPRRDQRVLPAPRRRSAARREPVGRGNRRGSRSHRCRRAGSLRADPMVRHGGAGAGFGRRRPHPKRSRPNPRSSLWSDPSTR